MTGVAVAFAGTIGFVGMVAPHVARMMVGNDYRYTIPVASICGMLLLLVADSLSRMLVTTIALPIGVKTWRLNLKNYPSNILQRNRR